MKVVGYHMFAHHDAVIILAAGPSINSNYEYIRNFMRDNPDHVVLACNYHFPIEADYTVFIDNGRYRRFINTITNRNVIVGPTIKPMVKKSHKKKHDFAVLKWDHTVQPYDVNEVLVNKDGSTRHKLGNCGMTCLFLSHFFTPSKVLAAGMDGPQPDNKTVKHFNNITRVWTRKDINRVKPKKKYLRRLVKFLNDKGATVYTFKNCPFWGQHEYVEIIDG